MKNFMSMLLGLLLFATASAQNLIPVSVTGKITDQGTGLPVPNWVVYAFGDFLNPIDTFGPGPFPILVATGTTDQNGDYVIDFEADAALAEVLVGTQTGCTDPTGGTSGFIQKAAPIVNGAGNADFEICPDLPPMPDCWADAWYYPTTGLDIQFNGNGYSLDSTTSVVYVWDFGDGNTSTEQNPLHTYDAEGFYDVTLTVTIGTCTTQYALQVWVYDFFNGSGDSVLVTGHVYGTDSLPVAGWYVSAGFAPPVFIPYYGVTDSSGFYSFWAVVPTGDSMILIETYDCTGFPHQQLVPIANWEASADFYICNDVPPFPGCAAYIKYEMVDSLTFQFYSDYWSNADSTNAPAEYLWDFGDGSTSTEANPIHTYSTDGIYTVLLSVTDANGCVAHACEVVFTLGGGTVDTFWYGCQAMFYVGLDPLSPGTSSNTLNFYDVSFGAVASWAWDFGDGSTSTEQNPTHVYAADGLYTVTLSITTLDGCESTMTAEVWVGDNPWNEWDCQAMFFPLPDSSGTGFFFVDMSFAPTPITSWLWDFGDGSTSTEQNPYHVYAQPGIYEVTLTIEADSCSSQFSMLLDTDSPMAFAPGEGPTFGLAGGTSGTQNPTVFEGVKLSPNPASSEIVLAFDSKGEKEFQIRVSDLSGKTVSVRTQKANPGANALRLDISNLPQGLYLAQILAGNGIQTLKFAKQ